MQIQNFSCTSSVFKHLELNSIYIALLVMRNAMIGQKAGNILNIHNKQLRLLTSGDLPPIFDFTSSDSSIGSGHTLSGEIGCMSSGHFAGGLLAKKQNASQTRKSKCTTCASCNTTVAHKCTSRQPTRHNSKSRYNRQSRGSKLVSHDSQARSEAAAEVKNRYLLGTCVYCAIKFEYLS